MENYVLWVMSLFGPKGPTYVFKLEGLTCSKCVAQVKRTAKSFSWVKKAKVSFDMKKLTIVTSAEIDTDSLVDAIIEEGFEAEQIS
jgi:copper chaperone CopZ